MNTHKMFDVTAVCIGDVIQMIDDGIEDELKKVLLIKRAKKLNKHEMQWIAKKLSDRHCDCCFWDNLTDLFEQIVEEDKLNKKEVKNE